MIGDPYLRKKQFKKSSKVFLQNHTAPGPFFFLNYYGNKVDITQKVNAVMLKPSAYYFYVKTKIYVDFQICISVPLKT